MMESDVNPDRYDAMLARSTDAVDALLVSGKKPKLDGLSSVSNQNTDDGRDEFPL